MSDLQIATVFLIPPRALSRSTLVTSNTGASTHAFPTSDRRTGPSKPPALSAIICSHNPRPDYFRRCLGALKDQTFPRDGWELIVVDNLSDEPIAARVDLSWHPTPRIVREEKLGLTPARLCGIRESRGEMLVFVDDDNVLDPNFIEIALGVAEQKQFLGAWSGQCRPEFEEPPPPWTRRYWGNLVVREFDNDVWSNLPRLSDTMPCGAGLCVRREVALHYLRLYESGKRPFQFDRTGDSLLSGGDNDLAGCACDIGLGVGLIASLKLTHLIPPERLTEDYLARLSEGIHYSGALLDYFRGSIPQKPSFGRRILFWTRLLSLKSQHARIARAVEQGNSRARKTIAARNAEI
jgi:glycosyltransferase involved in cell wall biosynthesis